MFDTHTQDPRVRRLLDTVSNRQSIRRQHSDEDATYETWTLNDIEKLFNDIRAEHVTEIRHLKDQVETERRGRLAAEKLARKAGDDAYRVGIDLLTRQRRLELQAQASPALIDFLLETVRGCIGRLGLIPKPQAMAEVCANNDQKSNSNDDDSLRALSDTSSASSQLPRATSTFGQEPFTGNWNHQWLASARRRPSFTMVIILSLSRLLQRFELPPLLCKNKGGATYQIGGRASRAC